MKQNTKTLTLPSGSTTKIRKLCARDYVGLGTLPDVFSESKKSEAQDKAKELASALKMTEMILLNCTGAIVSEGKPFRVVSKRFDECGDNEVSLDEFIGNEDAAFIVSEVLEFSGVGSAAREAARPFPAEQSGTGNDPSSGSAIPGPSIRVA